MRRIVQVNRLVGLRRFLEHRRFIEPNRQDPYRTKSKPPGTPQCTQCLGYSIQGRWVAKEKAMKQLSEIQRNDGKNQRKVLCPSCRETKDKYAASVIELHGSDWSTKADLIFQTLRRSEKIARARNDQERILWIENDRSGITRIFVSLPDLARQIGNVLRKTFKGHAKFHRSTEEPFLRVKWSMEADSKKKTPRSLGKSKYLRNRGLN